MIATPSRAQDIVRVGTDRVTLGWTPAQTGNVLAYGVFVTTNGGVEKLTTTVTQPRVTLRSPVGSVIQVRVAAIGFPGSDEPLTFGPHSIPSARIRFEPAFASSVSRGRMFVMHCATCATLELRTLTGALEHPVLPSPPVPWRMVGIDAFDDVSIASLWQHPSSGTVALIPLSHQDPIAALAIGGQSGYTALGLAEIDGDASREIVMWTPDRRALEFWEVHGTAITRAGGVPVRPDWRFVKAVDLDGDGISELWLQTHMTGMFEVWKVSMTRQLSTLARIATSFEGEFVDVADFDGDGALDALWRDEGWGVLEIARFTRGTGSNMGRLDELVTLPWLPGDENLLVRGAAPIDNQPGADIVVQDRNTYRVQAIFAHGRSTPRRSVLFDVTQRADLVDVN